MTTIDFLFAEPSALIERLSAPKRLGSGRYQLSATLSVHFDPGDATIGRLDAVLPMIAEVSDRLAAAEEGDPVRELRMVAAPRDEVRLRLREADAISHEAVDEGAELVTTATVSRIQATVGQAGVSVSVTLAVEVRADQVAELVRLLGATRAAASSEQLDLGLDRLAERITDLAHRAGGITLVAG